MLAGEVPDRKRRKKITCLLSFPNKHGLRRWCLMRGDKNDVHPRVWMPRTRQNEKGYELLWIIFPDKANGRSHKYDDMSSPTGADFILWYYEWRKKLQGRINHGGVNTLPAPPPLNTTPPSLPLPPLLLLVVPGGGGLSTTNTKLRWYEVDGVVSCSKGAALRQGRDGEARDLAAWVWPWGAHGMDDMLSQHTHTRTNISRIFSSFATE